jgi:C-terminal processing protease CtpA/Prc
VVENIAGAFDKYYVFPEVARSIGETLQASLAAGDYDALAAPEAFAERLTTDLQAVSHDKHIRVRYSRVARLYGGPEEEDSAVETEEAIALARSQNFGFYKVERLDGNIGYLDLRSFWGAQTPGAGETAVAAMNLLAHTDALIVDLRRNGGGSPTMIALLTSFLFEAEPVHLNSFYERPADRHTQSWTLPYVPGQRTPDKPVYVLTSNRTFSAAEEFTYNLKNLKRATIVGETTGGGANPGGYISATPHFHVFVPTGRAINPITSTNWEGTGVEPDMRVPQADALDAAYRLALGTVIDKLGDAPESDAAKSQVEEARAALATLGA